VASDRSQAKQGFYLLTRQLSLKAEKKLTERDREGQDKEKELIDSAVHCFNESMEK
jgi:hypothetical protein